MLFDDLTPTHFEAVTRRIHTILVYLRRMNERRFPNYDPLLRTALAAYDAIQALHVRVHYLSCKSGVRQIPGDRPGPRKHERWDGR
jgi:hypothetical protein